MNDDVPVQFEVKARSSADLEIVTVRRGSRLAMRATCAVFMHCFAPACAAAVAPTTMDGSASSSPDSASQPSQGDAAGIPDVHHASSCADAPLLTHRRTLEVTACGELDGSSQRASPTCPISSRSGIARVDAMPGTSFAWSLQYELSDEALCVELMNAPCPLGACADPWSSCTNGPSMGYGGGAVAPSGSGSVWLVIQTSGPCRTFQVTMD